MEIEKVKEIKKALECCQGESLKSCEHCPYWNWCKEDDGLTFKSDILTLINELESENKKLKQHKRELEGGQRDLLKVIKEFDKENQQLKDRIALLEKDNETLRNAKVVYENVDYCYEDLKKAEKRIAELEKENARLLKENEGYHGSYRCAIDKIGELSAERYIKVEQFAERLKEKLQCVLDGHPEEKGTSSFYAISEYDIDETLKEFLNE